MFITTPRGASVGLGTVRILAGAIAITFFAYGCGEVTQPTGPADLAFGKGNGQGGGPPGGGGGSSITMEFVDPVDLIGPAIGDYTAVEQPVGGSNGKNSLQVNDSPYLLTIDLAGEIAAKRAVGECEDSVFDDLGLASGASELTGELAINVNKRVIKKDGDFDGTVYTHTSGIVVNFTTEIDGVEYFLTTGSGPGAVNAMSAAEDTFARTGGFLRVNVDGQVGPICEGIVDYQFVVR